MSDLKKRIDEIISDLYSLNPYITYEKCKTVLDSMILSSSEYQKAVRYIADKLRI